MHYASRDLSGMKMLNIQFLIVYFPFFYGYSFLFFPVSVLNIPLQGTGKLRGFLLPKVPHLRMFEDQPGKLDGLHELETTFRKTTFVIFN